MLGVGGCDAFGHFPPEHKPAFQHFHKLLLDTLVASPAFGQFLEACRGALDAAVHALQQLDARAEVRGQLDFTRHAQIRQTD